MIGTMNETTGHIKHQFIHQYQPKNKLKAIKLIGRTIDACKKLCIERGWEIIDEYVDAGISGHLLEERLGLQNYWLTQNQESLILLW
jgi:hypothetical protein